MAKIRPGVCAEPGPGEAHCTDYIGHRYSCYDAGEDVSFNHGQHFTHECSDASCPNQHFVNEGD